MDSPQPVSAAEQSRLEQVLADYLQRVDAGEEVDRVRLLADHPDLAAALQSYFQTADEVDRIARPAAAAGPRDSLASRETVPPTGRAGPAAAKGPVQQQFGRYRLLNLLGKGAMGAVYLAHDTQLDRRVALKLPHLDIAKSREALERFLREAKSAATLSHPNICPVFDFGQIDGRHYISMAYIEGRSLSKLVNPQQPLGGRAAAELVRKLAVALQDAHSHGIIHRDLKPGNVIIDRRGEPVLMDFGLARRVTPDDDVRMTQDGALLGSPAYMSPEQVEGNLSQIDARSDIYSLGVILYELVTGRLPFAGSVAAVLAQIVSRDPAPASQVCAAVSPGLEAVIQKMMAKQAADRYATMSAAADALAKYLDSAPLERAGSPEAVAVTAPPTARDVPASVAADEAQRTVSSNLLAKLKEERQKAETCRKTGDYDTATRILKKMSALKEPQAAKYVEWAKKELIAVKAEPEKIRREAPAICRAVTQLLEKHDYDQAQQMLEGIPEFLRNEEMENLLRETLEVIDQLGVLEAEMDLASQDRDWRRAEKAAKQIVKLKPKHRQARELLDDLKLPAARRKRKGGVHYGGDYSYGSSSMPPWMLWTVVGTCSFFLVFTLGVMTLYYKLGKGEIKLEIDQSVLDEGATVFIDGNELKLTALGETIKAALGDHILTVRRGDEVVETRKFTVIRGNVPVIRISLGGETAAATATAAATTGSTGPPEPAGTLTGGPLEPGDKGAARWTVASGGRVMIRPTNGGERMLSSTDMVPNEDFAVTRLHLRNIKMTDADMERFAALANLEIFELIDTGVRGNGFRFLRGKTTLRELTVTMDTVGESALPHIGTLTGLKRLWLGDNGRQAQVTDKGMESLATLKGLESLNIGTSAITDAGTRHLGGLTELKEIALSSQNLPGISDGTIQNLSNLKKLEKLELHRGSITDNTVRELVNFPELTRVVFYRANQINGTGFAALAGKTKLSTLILNYDSLSNQGMAQLARLDTLQNLYLDDVTVSEEGLKSLTGMRGLKILSLHHIKMSPATLQQLKTALPTCDFQGQPEITPPGN